MTELISRQAAHDALDRTCNLVCQYSKKQRYSMCGVCPLGSAFDALTEVPTVDPVKHGKWVYQETWSVFNCSECGRSMPRNVYSYCPWCGARMDGE